MGHPGGGHVQAVPGCVVGPEKVAALGLVRAPVEVRMKERIRSILDEHARLSTPVDSLAEDADLYAAGMTSHATVNLMLALETEFDVEFPERMLRRHVFESIGSIHSAIEELRGAA